MSDTVNSIALSEFYPENLEIRSIHEEEKEIHIVMQSRTKRCNCSKCKTETSSLHATHHRKVQDLPILGKRVMLDLNLYEFNCVNPDCIITSFTETFENFLNNYSQMTERLVDLMTAIAIETICESCARILKSMNIKTSGDTVIRTLIKRYEKQPAMECGSAIGIDDFAYKKRHTYGTIIVDEETHKPIAILDGQDGVTLKEWLKKNKQVRMVTRDRASASLLTDLHDRGHWALFSSSGPAEDIFPLFLLFLYSHLLLMLSVLPHFIFLLSRICYGIFISVFNILKMHLPQYNSLPKVHSYYSI